MPQITTLTEKQIIVNQEFIENYFHQMQVICQRINRADLDQVIELLYSAWKYEKTVFIMGNGGSASTATHFACDLSKCTIVDRKKRMRVICLNDNIPLMSAWINDNGFENLYSEQLKNLMKNGDVLIGISVHGGTGKDQAGLWSQNLVKAMQLAKAEYNATLIGFSGFEGGLFKEICDACVVVPFDSTPQVESFHLALEHLVTNCLREQIEKNGK